MLKGILNAGFSLAQDTYTSRNIRVINLIFFVAALASFTMSVAFYFLNTRTLALFSIVSTLLYAGCLYLNARGRFFFAKLYFSLHLFAQCIVNYFWWGFDSGFWLYFLNFVQVAFIFSPRMPPRRLISVSVAVLIVLISGMAFFREIAPQAAIAQQTLRVMFLGNLLLSGFAFLMTIHYLNRENVSSEEELRAALVSARKANRAKTNFLSNVSHEMRTPLNAITGFSEVLTRQLTVINDASHRLAFAERLDYIQAAAKNLTNIINDILDSEKMETGRIVLLSEKFEIRKLVDAAIEANRHSLKKNVSLRAEAAADLPAQLISDASRISQVLNNLLSNAVKFTLEGEINLQVNLVERITDVARIRFSVSDTGIGIPAHRLTEVFERFSGVSLETGLRFGGTGLGLAITQTIVKALGGEISVSSTPGQGSTFTCVLPLRVVGTPEILAEETLPGFNRLKVLVAEDNEVNQALVTAIFKNWDIDITLADDGLKAVEEFNKNNYDLVLLDIQMPYMDGFEVAHVIRTNSDYSRRQVPIIALTADALHETREKCFAQQMDDVVLKPVSLEVLHAAMKRALAKGMNYHI